MPTFDILIPTLSYPERRTYYRRLMEVLQPQIDKFKGAVKVLKFEDRKQYTTGHKRQVLLERSDADYIASIDDDDTVPPDYLQKIMSALDLNPVCVGFKLRQFVDGGLTGLTLISNQCEYYCQKMNDDGLWRYYRTPNHLSPVRRELALEAGFPDCTYGEDAVYAHALYPHVKGQKEVLINDFLYNYFSRTHRHEYDGPAYVNGMLTEAAAVRAIQQGGSVIRRGKVIVHVKDL